MKFNKHIRLLLPMIRTLIKTIIKMPITPLVTASISPSTKPLTNPPIKRMITGIAASTVLILISVGCMKEPKFEQNFGDEVSAQSVDKAISEIDQVDPYTIMKGEYSYVERTNQVEQMPALVTLQRADTVINKTEDAADYIFTIVAEMVELIEGQMKPSKKEFEARLEKPSILITSRPPPPDLGVSEANGKTVLNLRSLRTNDATSPVKVTYHRLTKERGMYPVPTLVQKRTDCGGLGGLECERQNLAPNSPECSALKEKFCRTPLAVTKLAFDKVVWENGVGTKASYLFIFSPDVPYFSHQLLGCAETTVPYQGQRVHIRQCEEVKDFQFGHPN